MIHPAERERIEQQRRGGAQDPRKPKKLPGLLLGRDGGSETNRSDREVNEPYIMGRRLVTARFLTDPNGVRRQGEVASQQALQNLESVLAAKARGGHEVPQPGEHPKGFLARMLPEVQTGAFALTVHWMPEGERPINPDGKAVISNFWITDHAGYPNTTEEVCYTMLQGPGGMELERNVMEVDSSYDQQFQPGDVFGQTPEQLAAYAEFQAGLQLENATGLSQVLGDEVATVTDLFASAQPIEMTFSASPAPEA
ncbi:MAG TPA: hypothetical protein VMY99_02870 [Nevskiaceae bacterium]|nr:hypothetical protein [Nevskiaceae bacterium]